MSAQRVLTALILAVTVASPARAEPTLFPSRVALESLREKLKASGGDPAKIVRPRKAADLAALESGKRYKFVVRADGQLAVAPLPADAEHNEYVHPILADGQKVRTAGGLRVDRVDEKITTVTLDQDSQAYCPTAESLTSAKKALIHIGVPAAAIHVEDRPPKCVTPPK